MRELIWGNGSFVKREGNHILTDEELEKIKEFRQSIKEIMDYESSHGTIREDIFSSGVETHARVRAIKQGESIYWGPASD